MKKTIYYILVLIMYSQSIYSQGITRKIINLAGSSKTRVEEVRVLDDELLVAGANFFNQDSAHIFLCKLDTNLNPIKYVNLNKIDYYIAGSYKSDMIKTADDGYFVLRPNVLYGISYSLLKFDQDLELEWHEKYPKQVDSSFHENADKIFETDSIIYVFGNQNYYKNKKWRRGLFVDRISKEGVLLSRIEYLAFDRDLDLNAIQVDGSDYIVSYNFSESPSSYKLRFIRMNKDFEIIKEWSGYGSSEAITVAEDGSIYSITASNEPWGDIPPRHYVRKQDKNFKVLWTQEYLYPEFSMWSLDNPAFNINKDMIPDPRGGYYVMGDAFGKSQHFGYNEHYDQANAGVALYRINDEGEMLWKYMDSFTYIRPMRLGQLSSGSLVVLGFGYTKDSVTLSSNGIDTTLIRELPHLAMIKTDKDGCDSPGCRGTDAIKYTEIPSVEINISPNPSHDIVSIEWKDIISKMGSKTSIEVYNTTGSLMIKQYIENGQTIDISTLSPGVYLWKIIRDKKMIAKKKMIKL